MAWTTPRTWVAAEIVTASNMNTHVRDNLSFLRDTRMTPDVFVNANVGPTSATTELVVASLAAFTPDGSTNMELEFTWYNVTQTVATDIFLMKLYDGPTAGSGTQLTQALLTPGANTGSGVVRHRFTPTNASHTYTARLVRSSGTGTATLVASATAVGWFSATRVL